MNSSKHIYRPSPVAGCVLFVLLLISAATVGAQNIGKISGKVVDAESGEPLVGCSVTITGTPQGAATDVEGGYFILNITPGKYNVQASMIGYQKMILRDAIVNAGKTTVLNFRLTSSAVQQKEVVIEATRPEVEKEKTSTSAIIRADEVQTVAGIRDVGDILSLAADVTDGHFRGGRSGEEYYTLQGMGIVNPLNNSSAFLPIMSAVEEVEVITSGFGAQYGNAQSGVVNISMKEGRPDKWTTRIETRMRAPGRKHFGPSVFDPAANPYLTALLDSAIWKQGDGMTPYYQAMGSGLSSRYGGDTAVQLQVAQTLWRLQQRRDLRRDYGRDIDNSFELATGGPIDDNMRMFMALRSNTEWPVFPTEQPDLQRQVMGNIATSFGQSTLRISGGFSQQTTNLFPSSNGLGYFNWLWDRILSIDYQKTTNYQLGARFTETLSPSTFYEIKLNTIGTQRYVGSTPAPSAVADSLIINSLNSQIDWDKIIPQVITGPDQLSYMKGDDEFRNEFTRTVSLDASMTSQVTKNHMLNGGIQLNSYHIDVTNSLNTRRGAGGPTEDYVVNPYEAALYMQDKMEFEGMIANAGLRLDLWAPNTTYFPDVVVPYRQYRNAFAGDTVWYYNADSVKKLDAPILARLQPRVGISFPVSVGTVFHINYGAFMQRPSFQYLVSSQVQQGQANPIRLGNPRLQPETTNSYDLGVMQALGEGFTLDVSGYYKDVKNLIETVTYTSGSYSYSTWFNRDYADIRGFRIALTKRRGFFTGSANYQYSIATGKSATPSNAPVAYTENIHTGELSADLAKVPVRDILLNFDRTHNFILNLGFSSNDEWGPQVFGIFPLENVTISSNSFFRSGRPYTSPSNSKVINGARTPWEYNTNMRLTRKVNNFFGVPATFYAEVFNLFNQKILNYSYIFTTANANTTTNIMQAYEQYPIDDPKHGIQFWPDTNPPLPWGVDQSFLIYDNAPRSFNFGMSIEL